MNRQTNTESPAGETPTESPSKCPNCGAAKEAMFCCECGQNNRMRRLTVGAVFGPLIEELTELETPIVRTVIGLTIRPGRVCREFITGKRKRYTNPVKYCFVMGALFVLAIQVFDVHPDEGMQKAVQGTALHIADEPTEAGQPLTVAYAREFRDFVENWLQVVNLLIIPLLACVLMILYRRSGLNFAEHAVFLLYLYGHTFLIAVPLLLTGMYAEFWPWVVMQIWPVAYMVWAARAFYPGGWFAHTWKMVTMLIAKMLAATFIGLVFLIVYLLW